MDKVDFRRMVEGLRAKYSVTDGEAVLVPPVPSALEVKLNWFPKRYQLVTFSSYRFYGTAEQMSRQKKLVDCLRNGRPVVMYGNNGTGKTMLAFCAIRQQLMLGKDAVYTTLTDVVDGIKNCFSANINPIRVVDQYVKPDYLVIDEIDKGYGTETEFLNIFRIVNGRYNEKKSTVLISNASKDDVIKVVGQGAFDRIAEDGVVAFMDWPSYRGKEFPKEEW